ncbi:DUF3072 domain-containing protein [Loktanella sp. DJP18]|uniref:DUF3072 domain-containing protein n=1 Tax=Loktanella sp. DJP18 TaxID=3409788 RepID=UPI003BB6EAA2
MIPPTVTPEMSDREPGTPDSSDSPMTGDQADLLRALCEEASEPFNASLTQREALDRIEELRDSLNTNQNL